MAGDAPGSDVTGGEIVEGAWQVSVAADSGGRWGWQAGGRQFDHRSASVQPRVISPHQRWKRTFPEQASSVGTVWDRGWEHARTAWGTRIGPNAPSGGALGKLSSVEGGLGGR